MPNVNNTRNKSKENSSKRSRENRSDLRPAFLRNQSADRNLGNRQRMFMFGARDRFKLGLGDSPASSNLKSVSSESNTNKFSLPRANSGIISS